MKKEVIEKECIVILYMTWLLTYIREVLMEET